MESKRLPSRAEDARRVADERVRRALGTLAQGAPTGEDAREALAARGFARRLKDAPEGIRDLDAAVRAGSEHVCLAAANKILADAPLRTAEFIELDLKADDLVEDSDFDEYRPMAEKALVRLDDDELAWWSICELGWESSADDAELLRDLMEADRLDVIEHASLFVILMDEAEATLEACSDTSLPAGLAETLAKFKAIRAERWHVERGREAFALTPKQKEDLREELLREPVVLPFAKPQAPALAAAEGRPSAPEGKAFEAGFRALDGRWHARLTVPPGAEDDAVVFVEFRTGDGKLINEAVANCGCLRAQIEDGAAVFRLGDLREAWARPDGPVLAVDFGEDMSPGVRTD